VNSRLFTFVILRALAAPGQAMTGGKKFFRFYCSHCSPFIFINNFIVIQGEYTVKGEQWIVHLVAMPEKKDRRLPV
jgi:hypothetical protein